MRPDIRPAAVLTPPAPATPIDLPRPADTYTVDHYDDVFMVVEHGTGRFIYVGPGPVTVLPV